MLGGGGSVLGGSNSGAVYEIVGQRMREMSEDILQLLPEGVVHHTLSDAPFISAVGGRRPDQPQLSRNEIDKTNKQTNNSYYSHEEENQG